jgi:hypothetical protein
MSEYTAIFKCRLCGEVYKSGCTAGKEVAMNAAIGASQGIPLVMQQPSLTEVHFCTDESWGIADFQGFRKVDEK